MEFTESGLELCQTDQVRKRIRQLDDGSKRLVYIALVGCSSPTEKGVTVEATYTELTDFVNKNIGRLSAIAHEALRVQ